MAMEWQNLRPWNGSQHYAFEELCCQLASCEEGMPANSKFVRNGTPDGGIEGYWVLPSGEEYGWQAKFFIMPPQETQWRQIDDSVKTALATHPNLKKYTICLPIDLPDARIKRQKSARQKWDERVETWKKWAKDNKRSVEFAYWGESEIFTRLSHANHHGRNYFWFHKEIFSQKWFDEKIKVAIANAGPRYTPELNVDLPIAKVFGGLGNTRECQTRILIYYGEIKKYYQRLDSQGIKKLFQEEICDLGKKISPLFNELNGFKNLPENGIDWKLIIESAKKSAKIIYRCINALDEKIRKKESTKPENKKRETQRDYEYDKNVFYELRGKLSNLEYFAETSEAQLINIPALLMEGDAGVGKTHLFCDVAKSRIEQGFPSVLLLGEHFGKAEPWSQIISLLGLDCKVEGLLGALEAAAQASGSRAIIFIDALNEGEGIYLWKKYLAGMLETLKKYPSVGIAVSVRGDYRRLIVPDEIVDTKIIREVHYGLKEKEYEATKSFFNHYGIKQPSVPLLMPEFRNPLFLKLFCIGIKNKGLTETPSGIQGVTTIFKLFLDSVNEKLSKPEHLDFCAHNNLVEIAVSQLADAIFEKDARRLTIHEAENILNGLLPNRGYEKSLLRHLISEGILSESPIYIADQGDWKQGISFSYQRLSDHIIAGRLLEKHLDLKKPEKSFKKGKPFWELTQDEHACSRNSGLIEAFSIQIPEKTGKELSELAPHCQCFLPVIDAFIESLMWRNPKAISEATRDYINRHVIRYERTFHRFLNVLLTVALNPNHPYNADFIHQYLMKFKMADRDSLWSIFVHEQYGAKEGVDRLIDWAWSRQDKSNVDDESIRLCGVALAWFLTTSNRFVRDRATKALVNLFTGKIDILRKVIGQFLDVNDPYVSERLYAVAYGCAMRSSDNEAIGRLAMDVYKWVFRDGKPFPHLLMRDYARGVIEVAAHKGINLVGINLIKVRPPYKSKWPSIPTGESLKKYGEIQKGMPDEELARSYLYSSVMSHGDFARYILKGDHPSLLGWSSQRLNEPKMPSRKEIYGNFLSSLNATESKTFKEYEKARGYLNESGLLLRIDEKKIVELHGREFSEKDIEKAKIDEERKIVKLLKGKKLKIFQESVVPYLDNPNKEENVFDNNSLKRLILKKVFDLGWSVEKFGKFDRFLTRYADRGREAQKSERIGKKYQWIAYHEYLARIADNFKFKGDSFRDEIIKYDGPWQAGYIRDIDPSCLLKKTGMEDWQAHSNTWWFPTEYKLWNKENDDVKWMKNTDNLPPIPPLIQVINPHDNTEWLVLESYYNWQQPIPPDENKYEIRRREIWYMLKSYIVKKKDMQEIFNWAKKQNFMGRWMPESHDTARVFLGEYFWSPAHKHFNTPYYGYDEWTKLDRMENPKDILVSTDVYMQEGVDYDCSIDETIRIHLPIRLIVDSMKLDWKGQEGKYFDSNGKLVAFDPSIDEPGPSILLINKEAFLKFLNDEGYDIFWTLLGEKRILGGNLSGDDYKGRLEINGAYKISKGKIEGKCNSRFLSRG